MEDPIVGATPVVVFGHLTELSASIIAALKQSGLAARRLPPPCHAHSDASAYVDVDTAVGSALFVLDADLVEYLFGRSRALTSRRRLSACENATCDAAVGLARGNGTRRILVAVDGRRLSFGQRTRVMRWTRELLHRITYECSVNGITDLSTAYAIADTDGCVPRTAAAVVAWHDGRHPPAARNGERLVGHGPPPGPRTRTRAKARAA